LHWGANEPDYNPETEEVVSIEAKGDSVVVETQMAHNFQFRLRYELVNADGKWLIRDNRKCKSAANGKWKRWDL
jgi:hypothetical protein